MLKKIIYSDIIIILALLVKIIGFSSESAISKEYLQKEKSEDIRIFTKDGKEYEGKLNCWFVINDTLVIDSYNNQHKIPLITIEKLYANQFNVEKTASLVVLIVLLVGTMIVVEKKVSHELSAMQW